MRKKPSLIYGVQDNGVDRQVIGISRSWDDATFQTWNCNSFDPLLKFLYSELSWECNKCVGIFEIEHSPDYPHVASQNIGGVLFEGQVWFCRGSKNSIALHTELRRMFSADEPYTMTGLRGALYDRAKEHYEPQGCELSWLPLSDKANKIAEGYKIAYFPGTRREIWGGYHRDKYEHILMIRPKE